MLPTSSGAAAAASSASSSCSSGRQAPSASCVRLGNCRRVSAMVLLAVLLLLFLPADVQGDYENTWNSYYEQPCCGGTANGPFHLRHHGVTKRNANRANGPNSLGRGASEKGCQRVFSIRSALDG
uniref:Uncharacterized protein n=1 Tax=Anopheles atroparvus TaxID=41427 RepID=A0A182IR37_ANOAO